MDEQTKRLLRRYAARYEKADFLDSSKAIRRASCIS